MIEEEFYMTRLAIHSILRAFAASGIVVALLCPASAGEDATIKAFAAWQGNGQLFATGPKELTFVGALSGTVYVETERGPLESGRLVCPAMVRINVEDGSQIGNGRCTITAKDGAQVFADVSCTGIHLIGCDGQFTLTAGTKRFEGISGGGPVTLRSEFGEIAGISETSVRQEAGGIMFWPALHYTLP
jgi:hypothetical protein